MASFEFRKNLPATLTIEIEEVFKIGRINEQQYENGESRLLLWHGRRTTIFVHDSHVNLKGGLCRTSNAVNDCGENNYNDTCLMLLCEVFFGNTLELTETTNVDTLLLHINKS